MPAPDAASRLHRREPAREVRRRRFLDPAATFDYLSSLEWIRAAENVCMIGPAGTGKSHTLIALGIAAVEHGHRVKYVTAAELVETR